MKSQRYRMSNDKVWKQLRQRIHGPFRDYKKGLKYDDYMLPSGYYVSRHMEPYINAGLVLLLLKKNMNLIK